MSIHKSTGVHWSFWAIGAIALLWNLMGIMNYFMQMNPETIAAMPDSHRAIIETRPVWATTGFALAVFGGAIGSLLLLLKKSAAIYIFITSLLGVFVQLIHSLVIAGTKTSFNLFDISIIIAMPLLVAGFLLWYSMRSQSKVWLR